MAVLICFVSVQLRPLEFNLHFFVTARMILWCGSNIVHEINLLAPCVLYIGQAFRYSPENAFYIFNQQIYFII